MNAAGQQGYRPAARVEQEAFRCSTCRIDNTGYQACICGVQRGIHGKAHSLQASKVSSAPSTS